ncbi:small multi-drug export protein [Alkalihalobacillus sp. LMS6]|uniref:small multi-drug export protein n=1 Tax=Alkalihalobacillus sp. LMS6 TaxID=2924034 RepID=UPI0020D15391|nr:small multi-drug export protein [Alkalihalobacillus sp. LMS6]UTR07010.1 small multi-drug export protein [Alkalihalobacillus sp. LMS6]
METIQDLLLTLIEADTWVQYVSVFVISLIPFFESYVAVPIGVVFGFPSIPVIVIAILGNWLSVMAFIWIIAKFRKPSNKKSSKRSARAQNIFNKYGVAGLSFAGPLICYHVCAAISIASGAKKGYVSLWQGIAITTWSIALGVAFHYGVNLLEYVPNLNPFS